MSWHKFYVARGFLNSVGTTVSAATKLKYSDYLQMVAIASSAIATGSAFNFLVEYSPDIVGVFAGIATISATLGQYLQSKGD